MIQNIKFESINLHEKCSQSQKLLIQTNKSFLTTFNMHANVSRLYLLM